MNASYKAEIVLPSLLWRIDEAEQIRHGRGVSMSVYRAEVLRNLKWLLNTSAHPANDPIWQLPGASSSVLNFGIPPYSGRVGSSVNADELADAIHEAILRFEPRIIPDSLEVLRTDNVYGDQGNSVSFRISGSIWSQPVPERFSMETMVDTASGAWSFDA